MWSILKRKVQERKVSNIHQLRDVVMEEDSSGNVYVCVCVCVCVCVYVCVF